MTATRIASGVLAILAVAALVIGFIEGQTIWIGSAVALAITMAGFIAADRALTLLADIRDRLPAPKTDARKRPEPVDDIPPQFRD